ncbi:S24 family peptidase [Bacteroides stercoris]|jgi:phage repressor protein C with HTH and peptisase S24 domain|nr:S24 family peptidase [Bacteroides stercoris]
MNVNSRILEFVSAKGLSVAEFERLCGLSNGYVRKVKDSLGKRGLTDILRKFPELNSDWLLTGEGDMFLSQQSNPIINYTTGVPYYNVDFIGGFDLVLNDQTINPEYLIDFKLYNEATCWCNVTGHSMEPEIAHGDMIALKKIEDFSFIPFGEVYAIVTTNEMRTIKRIGPATNPENYSLIPTNKSPEYGIQELPKRMIRHIYHVLGCMKRL